MPNAPLLPEPGPPASSRDDAPLAVVPVVADSLEVHKEAAPIGAVRVRIEVEQSTERVRTGQVRERYEPIVQAVGVPANERREPYVDGDDVVIPVYEERVVVERRLFLKEEIRLRRSRQVEQQDEDVPLRRERAIFERQQADGSWRELPATAGALFAEHASSVPSSEGASEGQSLSSIKETIR